MPIREFTPKGIPRLKIAFLDTLPPQSALDRFDERRFQCVECTAGDLQKPEYIEQLDAVVFSQKAEKLGGLRNVLESNVHALLNNDVRIYIRIAEDRYGTGTSRSYLVDQLLNLKAPLGNPLPEERELIPVALREREDGQLAPYVYLFDSGVDWVTIAHLICDHPAGTSPKKELKVEGNEKIKDDFDPVENTERLLLLQRAFFDCSSLHLEPMADGLSGAPVYKAHSVLEKGIVGDWPYLHFVKIGSRSKIIEEYDKYTNGALDYVPFHLGPRLRLDRCNLGSTLGILVGDFVDGAEAIRDSAPEGRAVHAIANLFDKTLGAWRKQEKRKTATIGLYLENKWIDDGELIKLNKERAAIVTQLGGDSNVRRLKKKFDKFSNISVNCGPAHGDLHATNVLVRGSDAIIIDFEKMEADFPLLYDPASLEGGLLVEGFRKDKRIEKNPQSLLDSISRLYDADALRGALVTCSPSDKSSWFFDCTNQIRALSRHAEIDSEYALVLAVCLIRKGCNRQIFDNAQESLRAISFVLGQKILNGL